MAYDDQEAVRSDSFDPVAARVASALERFIGRLRTCRQLLQQANKIEESSWRSATERDAARRVPGLQRREIDQAVDTFVAEFPSLTEAALEQLLAGAGRTVVEPPPGTTPHPLAADEAGALLKFVVNSEMEQLLIDRFGRFSGGESSAVYLHARLREALRESAVEVQGAALLPEIVSAFERFLGSMVRVALSQQPRGFGEPPDIPYGVVERLPDREDVRRFAIDKQVSTFLRGKPSEWRRRLARWPKVDLGPAEVHWELLNEAIQRRHAVVHNESIVDASYLDEVAAGSRGGVSLGDRLTCDLAYTSAAIRSAEVVATVLALVWANKFCGANAHLVVPRLVDQIYALEEQGDWSGAFAIADTARELGSDEMFDDLLRVNWWLCKQRLRLDPEETLAEIGGWTPRSAELRAARLALLGDDAGLAETLRQVQGEVGALRWQSLRTMPIFASPLARSPAVKAALRGRRR